MGGILGQLGIDKTFFYQMAIFTVVFVLLGQIYFKPFLKLFQIRHDRTVKDKEAADKLMIQAQQKLEEYKSQLRIQKQEAAREFDLVIADAEKQQAEMVAKAWDEAKKITQSTAEAISEQRDQIRKKIEGDIDTLAKQISEKLLSRKG